MNGSRRNLLALLGGVSSGALLSKQAEADTAFTAFGFQATGGNTNRNMPDRLGEIVNVKDYGALGNNSNDDRPAIQQAITYAIGPRTVGGVTSKGGTVFFPAGTYLLLSAPNALVVGSSDSTIAVNLVGAAIAAVTIAGGISKGSNAFDNIGVIENLILSLGSITLTGTDQIVRQCHGVINASDALGASMVNCFCIAANSNPPNTPPSGPTPNSYGIALGNHCTAEDCRIQGADVAYAMGGNGGAIIGCSAETNLNGVRAGWLPSFALPTTTTVASGNVLTFAAPLPNSVVLGRYVTGTNIPAKTNITLIGAPIAGNIAITLSANITGTISSGANITFANETPAVGVAVIGFECERLSYSYFDLYNVNGGYFAGLVAQGQVSADPSSAAITQITWATNVATVQTTLAHNLTAGQQILQLFGGAAAWYPSYGNPPGLIIATPTDATHFTYDLPVNPGAASFAGMGWQHAQCYGIRCRKVHNTFIGGNAVNFNAPLASLDLEYCPDITSHGGAGPLTGTAGEAEHSNNIFVSNGMNAIGNPPLSGIQMPTTNPQNKAGWSFSSISSVNALEGHAGWVGVHTVANFNGQMNFADLPGQYSNTLGLYQLGPYEGQEYSIRDSTIAATAANFGVVAAGGAGNHVKLRYDPTGTPGWKISG